jgi:hypothetical protein
MKNPLDRVRQWKARRRYMPRARRQRTSTTARLAALAMVVIVAVAALLELRRGGGAEADLVEYAKAEGSEALEMVQVAGRSRRLLFLADIRSAAAPKRLAAEAIERLATTSGLDMVVLDIDADEQPHIDRYLATSPEDASILMSRPRAIREDDGESRSYLEIYRTTWRVNQTLGADRRIRIVAADFPGWPPIRSVSPSAAAETFGRRDDHMMEITETRVLGRSPNARVLFFMDGLHVLRSGGARTQTGGANPVEVHWLAAQLAAKYPQDVFTILVDAAPSRVIHAEVAAYRGTDAGDVFRRAGVENGTAVRIDERFDALTRTPVQVVGTTGMDFSLEPRAAALSTLADAYIFLGG